MRELLPAHSYATADDATGPPEGTITTFAGQTSSNQQRTTPPKPTKNATTGHTKIKTNKTTQKGNSSSNYQRPFQEDLARKAPGQNEAPKNPDQE